MRPHTHRPLPPLCFILTLCCTSLYAQNGRDPEVTRTAATPGSLSRNLVVEKSPGTTGSPLGVKMPQLPPIEGIQAKPAKSGTLDNWSDTSRLTAQLPSLLMMAGMTFLPAAFLLCAHSDHLKPSTASTWQPFHTRQPGDRRPFTVAHRADHAARR